MFEVIVYFVIPVLVILVISYLYVEAKRRKVEQENKKAIALRVATLKSNFKADLKRLVEQEILTLREQESAYRIANNFFVFQPVTNNSMDYCRQLLKNVIDAMPPAGPESVDFDLLKQQVSLFVRALPAAAGGYNGVFYRNELPRLIKKLVDSQDEIYEKSNEQADPISNKNSNEDTQPIVIENVKDEQKSVASDSSLKK